MSGGTLDLLTLGNPGARCKPVLYSSFTNPRIIDANRVSRFVTAATKRAAGLQVHLLRTYRHAGEFQPDLSLTQASHATLAASELVGPCAISAAGFSYVGGLPDWNNPTPQVLAEASHLWPDREVGGLISLGVGKPEQSALRALSKPLGRSIVERAEEAFRTGRQFEVVNHRLANAGAYFRLSAGPHLEGVGADVRNGSVQDATDRYLRTGEAMETIYRCAARLREPVPGPEPEAGPAEEQALSPPYEEKEEELVPYSAVMGEKSEKKRRFLSPLLLKEKKKEETDEVIADEKPEILLSVEEEKWLLKHKDQLDEDPNAVFPLAARDGHLGVVATLINRGLDINSRDRAGRTALHIAVEMSNEGLLQLLLEHGADLDAQDDLYETALLKAAKRGYASIGLKLLSGGADPNTKDSISWTPLSWACARGDEHLVKELAPRAEPLEEPSGRFSPLAWARRQGRDDLVKILEASPAGRPPNKDRPVPLDLISIQPWGLPNQGLLPVSHSIPIRVNGVSLNAELCTGSEATIMSVRCAAETKIDGLVDVRWSGQATGTGTTSVTGRVHLHALEIAGVFYTSSFTVIEHEEYSAIIGLDFLRRYAGTVNLGDDTLTLRGGTAKDGVEGENVNVVEMTPTGIKGKARA